MSQSTIAKADEAQTDDQPEEEPSLLEALDEEPARHGYVIEWIRSVDHPRDSLRSLRTQLIAKVPVPIDEIETEGDRTVLILEPGVDPPTTRMIEYGINRAMHRYNSDPDRKKPGLENDILARMAGSRGKKPRTHPKASRGTSDEEWEAAMERRAEWEALPGDAPTLQFERDGIHFRALPGGRR